MSKSVRSKRREVCQPSKDLYLSDSERQTGSSKHEKQVHHHRRSPLTFQGAAVSIKSSKRTNVRGQRLHAVSFVNKWQITPATSLIRAPNKRCVKSLRLELLLLLSVLHRLSAQAQKFLRHELVASAEQHKIIIVMH